MSGIKKFSELSLGELISRISLTCCYRCEQFQDPNSGNHWSCQKCECVCCDDCIQEGDVDNEEIGEDCGFYCEECQKKYLKEKENN